MRMLWRAVPTGLLAVAVAAPLLVLAQPGDRCTQDTLSIDGVAVRARFCIPAPAAAQALSVREEFTARGHSLTRTAGLTVVAGAQTSRTIDDVDLNPLGVKRSLHMTLAYHGGIVELEHALAIPGATPLK